MTSRFKNDQMYAAPLFGEVPDFRFDEKVVAVFPDMIQRSVPGYPAIVSLLGLIASQYAQSGTTLYDLGCSLGAATLSMSHALEGLDCHFVAVDNSPAMIDECRRHLSADPRIEIICGDIQDVEIQNATLVVLNFTLQFIAPEQRLALLKKIQEGLLPGGVLVLSEKLDFSDSHMAEEFVDLHHAFKRAQGYSDLEISQKRSALENVMIPDTLEEHFERLEDAGFLRAGVWYQCLNFASIMAWKS